MGNKIARTTQVSASEYYLHDLPSSYNLVLVELLGRGRFFKSILCKHDEGLVLVKVYFKRGEPLDLREYERRLAQIRDIFQSVQHPHVWPFQFWLETDKAAYLLRQYFFSNLHDRLSTRPFLSLIEKKWLAFQLLCAVEQSHNKGVCHGDIKCENVLVTSWNWLYLADFASFKPTYIPDDDPSDFSFFFDTGGRRRCYLAPEAGNDPVFQIILHYGSHAVSVEGVDPDKYSYTVLLSDITKQFCCDPEAWKTMLLVVTCDVPYSETKMVLDSDHKVEEMFRVYNGQHVINVYVEESSSVDDNFMSFFDENIFVVDHNADDNLNVVLNENIIDDNTIVVSVMNKCSETRPENAKKSSRGNVKRKTSARLAAKNGHGEGIPNIGVENSDDVELSEEDDIFAISDDENNHDSVDDSWFNKYCIHETKSDNGSEISNYGSENDSIPDFDSESNVEPDLLAKCLNRQEYKFVEGEKIKLMQGMIFENREVYRKVLCDYSIQMGFELVKIKNDRNRVTVGCAGDVCPWRVHASLLPDGVTFGIKTCNPDHKCQVKDNLRASAKWMSEKIVGLVRADKNVKMGVIREELLKYGLNPTKMQMSRAKGLALNIVDGSHADSYRILPKYCLMVMNTNPGSIARIDYCMTLGDSLPNARRVFTGFDALKKGFLSGCKPYLGFDGCHLKGSYGGVLLSAIGMDGNNGLYPVAFAVVETENKDSWCWFFELLSEFLDGFLENREWTFMTDRQKGLMEAIALKVPNATNRKCSRHIFANYRNKFPPITLRKLFWRAARSYNERDFKEAMRSIKELSPEAHQWLSDIGDKLWARYAFSQTLQCDNVTNNAAESFNSWIGELREKPIMTLLDNLRCRLMSKVQTRYAQGVSWTHSMTARVMDRLRIVSQESRSLTFFSVNDSTYEVKEGCTSYIVNTCSRSCDCRVWNHTGIPCKHVAAVLIARRHCLEDYCDMRLSRADFIKAYSYIINPVPDKSFWPELEIQDCVPPKLRRRIGRPRKARRREEGEATVKRSCTLKCSRCQQFGHNKRTCAGGPIKQKKSNTTNKKNEVVGSSQQGGSHVNSGSDKMVQSQSRVQGDKVKKSRKKQKQDVGVDQVQKQSVSHQQTQPDQLLIRSQTGTENVGIAQENVVSASDSVGYQRAQNISWGSFATSSRSKPSMSFFSGEMAGRISFRKIPNQVNQGSSGPSADHTRIADPVTSTAPPATGPSVRRPSKYPIRSLRSFSSQPAPHP